MPPLGRWSVFGPVLFYELLRTGRRGRYVAVRFAYGLALLVVLYFAYASWFPQHAVELGSFFSRGKLPPGQQSEFSSTFFSVFMVLQLAVVVGLTPAYTAGAIAEEKERGTLDALLASDLRGREIVLGKTAARLANLVLLVLTGLPVLGALQFLGGVDPNLVLAGFAVSGLSMVSLTGLGILCSVRARKPHHAIVRTYLFAVLYLALSGASWLLLLPGLKLASFPSTEDWISPVRLEDVVFWVNIGNPVALIVQLAAGVQAGGDLAVLLPAALRHYVYFHGTVAVGCLAWAVASLRRCALEPQIERSASAGRQSVPICRALLTGARPRVFQPCVLWKAAFAEEISKGGWFSDLANGIALALLLLPPVHLFCFFGRILPNGPTDQLGVVMNLWLRLAAAVMGSFLLLVVAFRAAGSVSGERERDTLDGLLVTPLSNRSILFGKWLGSILSLPQTWLSFAVIAVIGVVTGGFHPLGIAWFLAAWVAFAAVAASVGLWFSVASQRTHRATLWTAVALVILNVTLLQAAWAWCEDWVSPLPVYVLSPPGVLAWVAAARAEYHGGAAPRLVYDLLVIPALLLCAAFAVILWALTESHFRALTRREIADTAPSPPPEATTTVRGDRHEEALQPGAVRD